MPIHPWKAAMEAPGPSAQCAGLFILLVIKHGRRAEPAPCTEKAGSSPGPVGRNPGAGASPPLFARDSSPVAGQWQSHFPALQCLGGKWHLWGSLPSSSQFLFTSEQGKTHVKRQDRGPGWGVQLCSSTAIVHSSITPDQGFQSSIPGCWKTGRTK